MYAVDAVKNILPFGVMFVLAEVDARGELSLSYRLYYFLYNFFFEVGILILRSRSSFSKSFPAF